MAVSDQGIKRQIWVFLLLTFLSSWAVSGVIVARGGMRGEAGDLVFLLMWAPGLSAMAVKLAFTRSLRGMGWGWGGTKWQAMAYGIPLLYASVTYGLIWLTGLGGFPNEEYVHRAAARWGLEGRPEAVVILAAFGMQATVGVMLSCLSAMGEEIGWRGLLVPSLAQVTSYRNTALLSGAIWAVWHYPLLVFGGYDGGGPLWYSLICFTVLVMAVSFGFAWLRLRSGSLWTGVLWHASHNLFIQGFFTPITRDTGRTVWWTDEFGAGLPIAAAVAAWFFWRKRGEVEAGSRLSVPSHGS